MFQEIIRRWQEKKSGIKRPGSVLRLPLGNEVYTFVMILLKNLFFVSLVFDSTYTTPHFARALGIFVQRANIYIAFILLFLSIGFLFKQRARVWYLYILDVFVSFLSLAYLWYARGFQTMPSVSTLGEMSNLNGLGGTIVSLVKPIDVFFVINLLVTPFLLVIRRKSHTDRRIHPLLFSILFISSFVGAFFVPLRWSLFEIPDQKAIFSMIDPLLSVRNLTPIGYLVWDTYNVWTKGTDITLTSAQKSTIRSWYAMNQLTKENEPYKGIFKGKNLIIVQMESFEQFVMFHSINGQEITPNLNRLAREGFYFDKMHEQVREGTTSDAEFMANTSIYPLQRGSAFILHADNSYPNSLPKVMQRAGYHTVAIDSDESTYWNWVRALRSIGFQETIDRSKFKMDEQIGMGLSDGSLFRQVPPMLKQQQQPFYAFMLTLSGHAPFQIPDKYSTLPLSGGLKGSVLGRYIEDAHYVDTQIGQFIERLKGDGLLDNSVLVFYGDHEGVHKYYQKDVNSVKDKEPWMAANNKLDPLIVYNPQVKGQRIDTHGGEVDIFPTIAYLMGIDESEFANSAMGKNLLDQNESNTVLANGTFLGNAVTASEKKHVLLGPKVADMIIRGNYFQK